MERASVDPGALLIAVFAVGVGPLTESGPWGPINSGISVIVLAVVLCYLWPPKGIARRHLLALCIVLGFITGIGLAWPMQQIIFGGQSSPAAPDRASYAALVLTCVLAVGAYVLFRRQTLHLFDGGYNRAGDSAEPQGSPRLLPTDTTGPN
jgi:hypothetical protein